MKYSIVWIYLVICFFDVQAQEEKKLQVLLPNVSVGFQQPVADLSTRFGWNTAFGIGIDLLTSKNWIWGAEAHYLTGGNVKEDVFSNLRDVNGDIFGNDKGFVDAILRERGLSIGARFGKLFSFKKINENSGLRVTLGTGFLQHKIHIQDNSQNFIQTYNGYIGGYDRLTNGIYLSQWIGFQYLAKNRLINFLAGVQIMEGFTQSRRAMNYNTKTVETGTRLDLLLGFHGSWILPFYLGDKGEEVYY